MPESGARLKKGQTLCTLESVKAVGEVYCPVDGEVVESNSYLSSDPHLVNQDPEDSGWLVRLKYEGSYQEVSKKWKDAVAYRDFVDATNESRH